MCVLLLACDGCASASLPYNESVGRCRNKDITSRAMTLLDQPALWPYQDPGGTLQVRQQAGDPLAREQRTAGGHAATNVQAGRGRLLRAPHPQQSLDFLQAMPLQWSFPAVWRGCTACLATPPALCCQAGTPSAAAAPPALDSLLMLPRSCLRPSLSSSVLPLGHLRSGRAGEAASWAETAAKGGDPAQAAGSGGGLPMAS